MRNSRSVQHPCSIESGCIRPNVPILVPIEYKNCQLYGLWDIGWCVEFDMGSEAVFKSVSKTFGYLILMEECTDWIENCLPWKNVVGKLHASFFTTIAFHSMGLWFTFLNDRLKVIYTLPTVLGWTQNHTISPSSSALNNSH